MTDPTAISKPRKPRRVLTIAEKIAAAKAELQKLEQQEKHERAAKLERNRKAIFEVLKSADLDEVDAEIWEEALPAVQAALASITNRTKSSERVSQNEAADQKDGAKAAG